MPSNSQKLQNPISVINKHDFSRNNTYPAPRFNTELFEDITYAGTSNICTAENAVLVILDTRVTDLPTLLNAVVEEAICYILAEDEDALPRITQMLSQTGAKRLAIVAHGEPGVIHIGANPLNLEQLQAKAHLLQEWGVEEIALYSCEVGADAQFVTELERLTGANVAAATEKIGAAEQGGSWELNSIDDFKCFDQSHLAKYVGVLATTSINLNSIGGDSIINQTEAGSGSSGFTVTGSGNNSGNDGTQFLLAAYNGTTLIYWQIVSGTGSGGTRNYSFSLDFYDNPLLGSTFVNNNQGSLTFRVYQGTRQSGSPISGTSPSTIRFDVNNDNYLVNNFFLSSQPLGSRSTTATLDTIAPAAPSFALATDSGSSSSDGITNVGTVNVAGLETNATWQYSTNSGSTWIAGSGTSFTLAPGTYAAGAVRVRQTDLAGNTTTPSQNATAITVDNTAPTAGTLSLDNFTDSGASNSDNITTDQTFDLSLAGNEASSTISYEVSTDGGTEWTETTASQTDLADGDYQFRAVVTDTAGNTSNSNVISVTVDNTAPTAGTLSLDNFTDSGASNSDNIT
uniref:DUF4347 domain-containing protein n=2 Tax=unclassified Calothrix TaxID=2619626 RepID=UPI00168217A3